jgi:hypothetical protein
MDPTNGGPPPASAVSQALLDRAPPSQSWTLTGQPIVDGKYLDPSTGEIETHTGPSKGGPPSVSVYWQNRLDTGRGDQFHVISKTVARAGNINEYIIRVGGLLRTGACKLDSLNATRYNVYLVVTSELSQDGFRDALVEHGLL